MLKTCKSHKLYSDGYIFSLSNPTLPNLIYTYDEVGHVHDAYVRNDTAYLNCGNDGFKIIDFTYLDIPGGISQ